MSIEQKESTIPKKEDVKFEKTYVGCYDKSYKMPKQEFVETKTVKITTKTGEEKEVNFEITAGPLSDNDFDNAGEPLEKTYVLEIRYYDYAKCSSEIYHTDYINEANKLATEFCVKNGFKLFEHINSYPELQAVIIKD